MRRLDRSAAGTDRLLEGVHGAAAFPIADLQQGRLDQRVARKAGRRPLFGPLALGLGNPSAFRLEPGKFDERRSMLGKIREGLLQQRLGFPGTSLLGQKASAKQGNP